MVRLESSTTSGETTVSSTVDLSDYRRVGTVMFPFKQAATQSVGGQQRSFTLIVTDIKLNEGVVAEDFI